MSGNVEFGKCDVCQKENTLSRKYYYYDIQCECCGAKHEGKNVHFEIVLHCSNCTPKEPKSITIHGVKPMHTR